MEKRNLYFLYLVIITPVVLISWWMGFPRGYYMAFFGIGLGTLILVALKDELIMDRTVWKEYFIGLTGVILIPVIAIFNGGAIYISAIDIYYYLIGMTVFEIGIVPFYWIDDKYGERDDRYTLVGLGVAILTMLIISYILFISLNIAVVH